jgi:hypothetical protein
MRVVQPLEVAHHASEPISDRTDQDWSDLRPIPDVITEVDVASLSPGRSLRHTSIDPDHVARLVTTGGDWPPVLVHRLDLTVIDGRHRLMAALDLNLSRIRVEFFTGNETDAFVEALERNASHGLPLTMSERKDAATTLLALRAEWSDRMIGGLCGLSASTIRDIRQRRGYRAEGASTAHIVLSDRRIGRDGKQRPAQPARQRQKIMQALRESPGASLRSIASQTGASPATVRAVRQRACDEPEGDRQISLISPALTDPAPTAPVDESPSPLAESLDKSGSADPIDIASRASGQVWTSDTACSSEEESMKFAGWFDQTRVDLSACMAHLAGVPLSRVYEVADECMRRAQVWSEFASALQRRPARKLQSNY